MATFTSETVAQSDERLGKRVLRRLVRRDEVRVYMEFPLFKQIRRAIAAIGMAQ